MIPEDRPKASKAAAGWALGALVWEDPIMGAPEEEGPRVVARAAKGSAPLLREAVAAATCCKTLGTEAVGAGAAEAAAAGAGESSGPKRSSGRAARTPGPGSAGAAGAGGGPAAAAEVLEDAAGAPVSAPNASNVLELAAVVVVVLPVKAAKGSAAAAGAGAGAVVAGAGAGALPKASHGSPPDDAAGAAGVAVEVPEKRSPRSPADWDAVTAAMELPPGGGGGGASLTAIMQGDVGQRQCDEGAGGRRRRRRKFDCKRERYDVGRRQRHSFRPVTT